MTTRWICIVGMILGTAAPCLAQNDLKGKMELSIGGSVQSLTVSSEGQSETSQFFNVPIRTGYFITNAFELEAEGIVSAWDERSSFGDGSQFSFVLSGNASYNFPAADHVRPFLLAGVGVTDTYLPAIGNSVLLLDAGGTFRTIFNLGAGFKALLGNRAAFRAEYRLQSFPENETEFLPGYTSHTVQLGVSLFVL